MRRVALTSAAVTLVLGLAGVVAIAAASQAAEPSTAKSKTLTFDVVFRPFSLVAANNVRDPNSPIALGTRSPSTTNSSPGPPRSATPWAPA